MDREYDRTPNCLSRFPFTEIVKLCGVFLSKFGVGLPHLLRVTLKCERHTDLWPRGLTARFRRVSKRSESTLINVWLNRSPTAFNDGRRELNAGTRTSPPGSTSSRR